MFGFDLWGVLVTVLARHSLKQYKAKGPWQELPVKNMFASTSQTIEYQVCLAKK